MVAGEVGWDPRPLPAGWSLGYDEENQRCCYFHYETTPPSISYIHPLDINPTTANICRSSRPLPRPPGSLPPYEPSPLSSLQKQPSSSPSPKPDLIPPPSPKPLLPPPSPKAFSSSLSPKPSPHRTYIMQNPPPKLSAAQQLYASSFANHGPSIPTLPPPSLETQSNTLDRPSLYKNHVASYVQSSPPALRPRSPASTISSLSSSMSPQFIPSPAYSSSFEPQSPPYSERSFSEEGPQATPAAPNSRLRLGSTSHPRGHSESDGYFPTSITAQTLENPSRSTSHNTTHPTRNLFPLAYIDSDRNKPREVRTVTTAVKAPLQSDADTLTPGSSIPSTQLNVLAHPTKPVFLPPPPQSSMQFPSAPAAPPLHHVPQQQQMSVVPARPQGYAQPNLSLQSQPQSLQLPPASSTTRPPKPTKPGKKPSSFMSTFGSSLASSLGQTAAQVGVQSILSGLGIEEEDEGDDGGIVDALASGFAGLNARGGDNNGGGGGGDAAGGDPVSANPAPQSSVVEYTSPSEPGVYYTQHPGVLPATEFRRHSNNGGDGHDVSNVNSSHPTGAASTSRTYSGQVNLPTGAQQPYLLQRSPSHQPQSPGWNPYQYH